MATPKSMLVFSIALNGYQWLYRDCLRSHKHYADKIGAEYLSVQRPFFTQMGTECCWLKLLLLKQALQKGYQQVLFLDADAHVRKFASDIRDVMVNDKHIYMALGKTHRFNSGVILARQSPQAIAFIDKVLANRNVVLAPEHDVGWGENGHIIAAAQDNPWVQELELEWNNTWQPELKDNIRHFNHGVMRNQICGHSLFNLVHRCLAKTTRGINQLQDVRKQLLPGGADTTKNKNDAELTLQKLFFHVLRHHPQCF